MLPYQEVVGSLWRRVVGASARLPDSSRYQPHRLAGEWLRESSAAPCRFKSQESRPDNLENRPRQQSLFDNG